MQALFCTTSVRTKGSLALLVLRLICGVAFMMHGWGKIQNPMSWMGPDAATPGIFQFLAALSEFGGGLAWILGLLTRLASFGILCTMVVAVWAMYSNGATFVGQPSFELPAVYFAVALCLMCLGGGKYALDRLAFRKCGVKEE